jgi:hypothetical protein
MAVKLVGEFWTDARTYDDLIRRCFVYLFRKYPDPEGEIISWNKLMEGLYNLNILSLSRFDPSRYKGKKSVDRIWEAYLYKWIEHFLGESFNKNGKMYKRFINVENMDSISSSNYGEVSMIQHNDPLFRDGEISKEASKKVKSKISKIPQWASKDCFPSEPINPLEKLEYRDLLSSIRKSLRSDQEKKVFEAMHNGCAQAEVADAVKLTPAAVSAILKKIRDRCAQRGILPKVYSR